MLVSEAIQYLNTFTFTSSSLNDDERIDALLKSLNLAHFEIYKRFWSIPDFEELEGQSWDNLNLNVYSINRTLSNIFKLKNVYNDTFENIQKNLFNSSYLLSKKNNFTTLGTQILLENKPFLETYQMEDGSDAQRYTCTIRYIPQPKKLALEQEGNIDVTTFLPYPNIFFDALLAKALLYHHSTLDGTNPKYREWQQEYNQKIKYLDGYYNSNRR